jgi:hypothetical protein
VNRQREREERKRTEGQRRERENDNKELLREKRFEKQRGKIQEMRRKGRKK